MKAVILANDKILQQIINSIVELVNPDKIILFGSRATGKAKKDSDYDICVLKKNIKKRRKLSQYLYMNMNTGIPVDIVVTTPRNLEENKDNWYYIDYDIFHEGKVIYEK